MATYKDLLASIIEAAADLQKVNPKIQTDPEIKAALEDLDRELWVWRDLAYEEDDHGNLRPDPDLIDGVGFADPGGESALRAASPTNPRNLPCPTCGRENMLTPLDRARGYHCNRCANQRDRGW